MKKIISCLSLLSWLLIPAVTLAILTNYLIDSLSYPSKSSVLGKAGYQTVLGQVSQKSDSESTSVPPNNLEKIIWKKEGLVTIWMDDAWASQYETAFPALEEKRMKAALAVPINLVGYEAYIDWLQIQRLQYKGWEITSHTRSHSCESEKLNEETLNSEIGGAKADLQAKGLRAEIFVSPCGVNFPEMDAVVKKSHIAQRTSEPGFNPLPVVDPYHLKVQTIRSTTALSEVKNWLAQVKETRSWLILAFHQIDEGGLEFSVTPNNFREMLKSIESSGLKVVLPSQVLSL